MVRIPINNGNKNNAGEPPPQHQEHPPENAATVTNGFTASNGKPNNSGVDGDTKIAENYPPEETMAINESTMPEQNEDAEYYKKMAEDYLDTLRRVQADFENYKKRVRKEKADTIRYATEGILAKLIGITDNLKRGTDCAANLTNPNCLEDMIEGIMLINKQSHDLLAEYGVTPYQSVGKQFDPALHECICLVEQDDLPENTVVEEFQTGYKIHDRVLRPAKVSVSKKTESKTKTDVIAPIRENSS